MKKRNSLVKYLPMLAVSQVGVIKYGPVPTPLYGMPSPVDPPSFVSLVVKSVVAVGIVAAVVVIGFFMFIKNKPNGEK